MVAAFACLAAAPVSAAAARSAVTGCAGQAYSRPFLPFGDPASYVPVPGGAFDAEPGWTLAGGAAVVDGGEPFRISGSAGDDTSLLLGAGAAATSPPLCVTLLHPTIRFVVRTSDTLAVLSLRVLYTDVSGGSTSLEFARILGTSFWFPTAPLPFLANAVATAGGTAVAFQFVALSGTWQVDDVYVDPYKNR